MKRLRCPRCDRYVVFDDSRYPAGQALVFVCPHCGKEFRIRLGGTEHASHQEGEGESYSSDFGYLTVVENTFAYRQQLPLHEGDNLIGRRNKGTDVDIVIDTNDPSMDRRHCYIHVKPSSTSTGRHVYTLRDNNSNTGTFLMNNLLEPKDRIRLSAGDIITLGATTLILHTPDEEGYTPCQEE